MGIALIKYVDPSDDEPRWGELVQGRVYPLEADFVDHRALMTAYFENPQELRAAVSNSAIDLGSVTLLSPISQDVQLFCQGLNYAEHRLESGASHSAHEENLIFAKAGSSISGPNDNISRPEGCELLDFEVELGLVVKRSISEPVALSEATIGDYVGGLVLCNDVSARDLMFGAPMLQWFKGKSYRTFCPTGPVLYLMDPDESDLIQFLELKLWLNGELKQHATTDQLIHSPAKTLSELSEICSLYKGDCLLTGTPGGVLAQSSLKTFLAVILNFTNDAKRKDHFQKAQLSRQRFLQAGDVVELEISSIDRELSLGRQRCLISG